MSDLPTRLVRLGRDTRVPGGPPVNPPIVRMSTALFADVAEMRDLRARRDTERLLTYGARGNPTGHALEDLVTELEGGFRTRLFPTGQAAISHVLSAYLRQGDHVLISDAVYPPVRHFAATVLARFGVTHDFFAADGSGIEAAFRPQTRIVYVETPGSFAYEIADLPAIAAAAHARGALVVADNTWGAGVLYRPLELGADVSLTAATKYLGGHSDVMMGTATATEAAWAPLTAHCDASGVTVGPDDAWLTLRGARTLTTRLAAHEAAALEIAERLSAHPEVARVLHPVLPDHPGHALWRRDCHGSNGLLSFALKRPGEAAVVRFVESLRLFGLGASWGGYESLVTFADLATLRSISPPTGSLHLIRLHVGLEAPRDLLADLECGFAALHDDPP